jgi:hypothetical protein
MADDYIYSVLTGLPDEVLSRLGRNHPEKLSQRWQDELFDAGILYQHGRRIIITSAAMRAVADIFRDRFVELKTDKMGRVHDKVARGRPGGWGG